MNLPISFLTRNRYVVIPLEFITGWLKPKSTEACLQFHERTLRFITLMVIPFLVLLIITGIIRQATWEEWRQEALWYGTIIVIAGLVAWAIRLGRIRLAGRLSVLVAFSTLFDVSVAYWSPGTVILTILFSFMFLVILLDKRDVWIALGLTFSIYLYITLTEKQTSPLMIADIYSGKLPAIINTFLVSMIFLGLGVYIRRDQAAQDKYRLLVEAERTGILRQFLANVSHDLKTPITRIRMDMYFLQRESNPSLQKRLDSLENSVTHLEAVLDDVMEMSRLESQIDMEKVHINLVATIQMLIAEYTPQASKKRITLVFQSVARISYALIDQVRLQRAIGNILENAIQFTEPDGMINVRILDEANQLIIEVSDTGRGIATQDIPHIFDHFFRSDKARNIDQGKMGLGLAISKKIIEMHNGKIEVKSVLDKGTTFRIILPSATQVLE